jgi:transposase-like protein
MGKTLHGRRWRPFVCLSCRRYFLETVGTPLHGKQVDPDKLVWAIAALAEGLGIRAVARVFETEQSCIARGTNQQDPQA